MVRAAAKRSTWTTLPGAPTKKQKGDPATKAKCDAVTTAFKNAEELPAGVRQMLDAMLAVIPSHPEALRTGGADCLGRAPLTGLFSTALSRVEAGIQAGLDDAEAKVKGGDVERANRDSAVEEAKASLAEQQKVVSEKQELLSKATAALQGTKEALNSAQAAQRVGDADLESAGGRLELLRGAKADVDALKTGSAVAGSSAKQITALVKLLGSVGLDQSLLTAIPTALGKAPDARGAFDTMVVTQLDTELDRNLRELEDLIQSGEIEKTKRAETVSAAQAAHGVAKEEHTAAVAVLSEVQAEQAQRETALKAAQKAVKDLGPELLRHAGAVDSAKASLGAFREGPLAAFAELTTPLVEAAADPDAPAPASEGLAQEPPQEPATEAAETAPMLPLA